MWLDQRFQRHSQGSEDSTTETGICAVSEDNAFLNSNDDRNGFYWHCGQEEEEMSLPQDVIDDLLNDVHDSDKEEDEDGDCILQNGI